MNNELKIQKIKEIREELKAEKSKGVPKTIVEIEKRVALIEKLLNIT